MESVIEISLDKIFTTPPPKSTSPAVSVIIPLYNAEEYIGECLDSLLIQTFQDFEVIVVDDCSTDNSVAIVESYKEKFGGRLTFTKTEKNSGGGGYVPRNIGINLASGEYIQFLDADDLLLGTALEILHTAAKQYDAEVVYTGSYYDMKTPTDIYLCQDGEGIKLLKKGFEDKPYLRIDDRKGNLERLMVGGNNNLRGPWSKFIRRDFLIDNKILFPSQMKTSGDFIWTINVYCHAKRFLRLPISVYFYRRNIKSVTLTERESYKQVAYLVSVFVDFMSNLRTLENENTILLENSSYIQAALNSHFKWFLQRTKKARAELSDQEIYDALHREFAKDTSALTVLFFFSFIDNLNKANEEQTQTIKSLEKKLAQLQRASNYLPVSVIIPLYNAEKYIGECLDSLLDQTFQNFEVIVVDDCSTDNGPVIVGSYKEKFDGRLTLTKTEENSGGGGLPRNKGITLSRGEYIQFLDADDMLTKTALEEMYTLAKDYNADVVNCEKFYHVDDDGTNIRAKSYQEGKFVSKPTFESEDLKKRVQNIIDDRYLTTTCNKFVRRDLITENEIFFPSLKTSEDNIWTQGLIFYGKKFLRVPNVVYIYRQSEGSSQRAKRTPQQHINFWLNPVLLGLKSLDNLMSRHEFFKANPSLRFALLKKFIDKRFRFTKISAQQLSEHVIYTAIKEEFGEKLGDYDVLIPALCSALYDEKKTNDNNAKTILEITSKFTARVDIKFLSTTGDFKIISLSDEKATVEKPAWFNKSGIGYVIQSYAGKLEIVAQATADGQLELDLKGMDVRNPKGKPKRIPYWIDYTKLTVNGEIIFDELTPAWHDKPYAYKMNAKAGEEIKIQVEWLPHRSDN